MSNERKALVVGINQYDNFMPLAAAVADAKAIAQRLALNDDDEHSRNFAVKTLFAEATSITRPVLRAAIRELFDHVQGHALFYFAGHGVLESTGAFIASSDAVENDWGIPMQEIIDLGLGSRANIVTMIFDCCHSGNLGNPAMLQGGRGWKQPMSIIRENMTVVAASTDIQTAMEGGGHGLFTAALLDALDGAAADLLGDVTTSSLYAHVDRRFGPWQQRPVTKSYIATPTVVRRCRPKISLAELRRLTELFTPANSPLQLDPDYDPDCNLDSNGMLVYKQPIRDQEKLKVGQLLKKYRDVGLVRPVLAGEQLFFTAQLSHSVELTPVGQGYWQLIAEEKL